MAAAAAVPYQCNILIYNKLYTHITKGCRAKRVEKYINQNTRKDTLLKRQQFVTKNQETSVKTELSPDKLYYKSHLSGLKRFLMDELYFPDFG